MAEHTHGPHGIDLRAAGGIQRLLDFHRAVFGDAVMQDGAGGGEQSDGQSQSGQQPADQSGQAPGGQGSGRDDGGRDGHDDADEQLGEPGKRALQAERSKNQNLTRELTEARQRLQELEDKDKTEEQRRDERLQQLEQDATSKASTITDLELTIEKYRVAAAKGLDLVAAERLRGQDKQALEQDADEWIQRWGAGPAHGSRHVPDPGQGPRQKQEEDPWEVGKDRASRRFGSDQK